MNPQQLNTTKITRKRFLQLSLLAIAGLALWSPFRQDTNSGLTQITNQDGGNLPLGKMKTLEVLSQSEYDALYSVDSQTMYIIT